MKKIPSTSGLFNTTQKMDRSAAEKTRGITAEMVASAEKRIREQSTLIPNLSNHKQKAEDLPWPTSLIG